MTKATPPIVIPRPFLNPDYRYHPSVIQGLIDAGVTGGRFDVVVLDHADNIVAQRVQLSARDAVEVARSFAALPPGWSAMVEVAS